MQIEFGLMQNAIDSLERSIDLLAWRDEPDESRKLKEAIQSIAHGVELLLKERLRRIHPALLWESVDKYQNLDARTVGCDLAVARLERIGKLHFAKEDVALIRALRATRNAIEHYQWSTTRKEAERIIGEALAFAVVFASNELHYDFFGYRNRKDDTLPQLCKTHPHFAVALERLEMRQPDTGVLPLTKCPFCRAIGFDSEKHACAVCGHWEYANSLDDDDYI